MSARILVGRHRVTVLRFLYTALAVMLLAGVIFIGGWISFALVTLFLDRAKHGTGPGRVAMG